MNLSIYLHEKSTDSAQVSVQRFDYGSTQPVPTTAVPTTAVPVPTTANYCARTGPHTYMKSPQIAPHFGFCFPLSQNQWIIVSHVLTNQANLDLVF